MRYRMLDLLTPPVYTDAERDSKIKILYWLMGLAAGMSVLYSVLHPLITDRTRDTHYVIVLTILAIAVCHTLAKNGKFILGAHVFVLYLWAMMASSSFIIEGALVGSISLFSVPILVASMVLGEKTTYSYAIFSILTCIVLFFIQDVGLIPLTKGIDVKETLLTQVLGFITVAILLISNLRGYGRIKEEFSDIQRYAQLGGWMFDTRTLELTLSQEYLCVLGYRRAKSARTFKFTDFLFNYVDEDDRGKIVSVYNTAIAERKNPRYTAEFVFKTRGRTGKYRYIQVRGSYKEEHLGFGTGQDITEQYKSEEELRKSQELFLKVFRMSPNSISISDMRTGTYIDVNEAFTKTFGYTRAEVKGKTCAEIGIWKDPKERKRIIIKLLKEDIILNEELCILSKNGEVKHAEYSARVVNIAGKECLIEMVRDISDRKEAQELRRLNQEISAQNQFIEVQNSKLAEAMESIKRTQAQIFQSEKRASLGQIVVGLAHEINNPLAVIGSSNEYLADYLERTNKRANEAAVIYELLDTDTREQLERMIDMGQRAVEIPTPREIRNKATKIEPALSGLGYHNPKVLAEWLVESGLEESPIQFPKVFEFEQGPQLVQYALEEVQAIRSSKMIRMSVNRTSKILYALQNFSHPNHSGEKTLVNLFECLETVFTIYHNQLKSGVQVVKEYNNLPLIEGYADDLLHVWMNLIYNAAQAMHFQGVLTVSSFWISENEVEVRIKDTGPGIPEAIQHRIFEPFFTTKAPGEGSGLGLDIARRIVENHGGSIRFETSSKGTTFFVRLPVG
ncbi:hypothetical protein CH373_01955 [Leptospira perolatii]|uniref:histidine kinase n=1 Tax=Leptospira perolatii TaxID=2023191 RepID=A0A2M9ZS19_9LEPT|nr:ATP-binding protein [Leptospira perolatii]PJZ71291.1 hypothetical protein CH360_01955 [Leptospira perolatii]PJZ74825.1 hypothetical protein CH373_01955 [Leptospira perolatii]